MPISLALALPTCITTILKVNKEPMQVYNAWRSAVVEGVKAVCL
jgi:hypothetical protein